MKNLFLVALVMTLSSTAFASGGTWCSVDNDDVKIDVNLANGTLFGSPIIANSSVAVEIKNSLVVGIANYTFKKTLQVDEIPYWFAIGDELKLGAYVEPETDDEGNPIDAFVTLAVVIDTKVKASDSSIYEGTYRVIQTSNSQGPGYLEKELTGAIVCNVE